MIVSFEELPELRKTYAQEKIVLAGGCFDIVHEGHVRGMNFCKSLGSMLIVGVSSDERIRQRKGPDRPIRDNQDRLTVVDAFKAVNYAFLMPMPAEDTPTIQVIKALQPDIFADHLENHDRWLASEELIASLGTTLVFNTTERQGSSTEIINKIATMQATQTEIA